MRRNRPAILAAILLGTAAPANLVDGKSLAATAPSTADFVLGGGTIYTGAQNTVFVGDVAITGDKIIYVGPSKPIKAKRRLDIRGMIVTPGFIDAHSHPDSYIRSGDAQQRLNAPWLLQGVSTIVTGVDGFGTPDVKQDAETVVQKGIGTNIVPFIGFGAIRSRIIGNIARDPTPTELNAMKALVRKGMCEGASGLSTGLFYAPQSYAKTAEVIALTREIAPFGGLYDTHQRDESNYSISVLDSVREGLQIGREAGVAVHFAHLKALGVDVHGKAGAIIALINNARAAGMNVTADQYPWLASGTNLEAALVPRWAVDGGRDALLTRLNDAATRVRITAEMQENLRRRGGAAALLLTSNGRVWSGKTLDQMAATWHLSPIDAAIRIIRDQETTAPVSSDSGPPAKAGHASAAASFNMIDADVDAIMQQPWVITGSDGSDGHPRQYATFPEKYAAYVQRRGVISLGDFVRRSTGLTADIYQIDRRGYLRPGYFADVLVFDPAAYAPRADYQNPARLSTGVRALFVNGALAVEFSQPTGAAAGRALLRTSKARACRPK